MQLKITNISATDQLITITADKKFLDETKEVVLKKLGANVKISGFREGKSPLNLVEKQVDQSQLQSEFLDEAINNLYGEVIKGESIRPVDRPEIEVKKFVPFSELEFTAKISVISPTKLPDYKKLRITKPKASSANAKDIDEVLEKLQIQAAERKDVSRAAKNDDQVWIDFKGVDDKGKAIEGAESTNYPLTLGSKTFIPGFEENLIGLKPGESKTFNLTFPKDYQLKVLANRKVTFTVSLIKLQELTKPKIDDKLAEKAGPFKTLVELKADIKKQLALDKQNVADREFESEVLKKITDKSQVAVPEALIESEIERQLRDLKQNLNYRGQTYPEFLEQEKTNETDYKQKVIRPSAEDRVKASIVLSDIAEAEKVSLTEQEVGDRLTQLRAQYTDQKAQEDIATPEFQRDLASRMLAEKTIKKLVDYVTAKK